MEELVGCTIVVMVGDEWEVKKERSEEFSPNKYLCEFLKSGSENKKKA